MQTASDVPDDVADDGPAAAPAGQSQPRWRRVVAGILTVVTALMSIVTVLSGYVRDDLLTTEGYLRVVAPLARNPVLQREVIDATTAAVVDNIRVDGLTRDALEVLRAGDSRLASLLNSDRRLARALDGLLSGLGPLLQNQVEAVARRAAERVVHSDRFADLWVEANRRAHAATLTVLRDDGAVLRAEDGAIRIDISVVIDEVRRRLVDSGFTLADRIPASDRQLVLVRSDELAKAQTALRLFDQIAPWVPWLTLALGIGAVVVAPRRRRTVQWLGAAIAAAMVGVAIAVAVARQWFLDRVVATEIDPAAAAVVVQAALHPLWSRLWLIFAAAGLTALVAWASGFFGSRSGAGPAIAEERSDRRRT